MPSGDNWKIVIIDDEKDILDVVSMTLKDAGHTVMTAENGEDGLLLCREVIPQIVITDIRMPKMDGIQVLGELKKTNPDIEVIVVTGFGDIEMAIRALQLDASDFITKPINDAALHTALSRAQERYSVRKKMLEHMTLLEKENAKNTQELSQSIAYQRNLIESSMDGIIGIDENRNIIIFNKAMENMLGFSKAEVIKKISFGGFFPSGGGEEIIDLLEGDPYGGEGRLFLYETTLVAQNRNPVPVQVSATLITDRGKANGMVFFFRDLREVRRMETQMADQAKILHQDKMMSLGRLAASVVHEINNPLFGVLNYLQLMTRIVRKGPITGDQKEKFEHYLELAQNETSRCSQIISTLLTFSRKSSPAFDCILIPDLLERCKILCQHKLDLSSIRLEYSADPEIPAVKGDFNQLQQCLFNLIFNAIDAMPEGGSILIKAGHDSSKVLISVQDTGIGIQEADIKHIFEPFYTTKKEGYGVGLGLSTVYGIIENHHGSINVESTPGKGTTFTLELPIYKKEEV